ncbi:MAG TPA: FAD-dependent monooxygenase [Bacteroidia bacterium]|nr:FAD-dependent monooxygenase [Bacteroidia bacterium]
MIKRIDLVLPPEEAANESGYLKLLSSAAGIPESEIIHFSLRKRSIDARSKHPKVLLSFDVYTEVADIPAAPPDAGYQNVTNGKTVAIVGCGPAGLFAALRLLQAGCKPVIIERGKNVRDRRRNLAALNKLHTVNPHSNYCFGEGGAGTYSDGKLYTRSDKRGNVKNILDVLVRFGADPTISVDAHPHIGTNKLPGIISAIREMILDCGGEIVFNTLVSDISIKGGAVSHLILQPVSGGTPYTLQAESVILATGHSARDIYEMLFRNKITIQSKPFALGVRVEHPQPLIDRIQYHCDIRGPYLPAASYSLSAQVSGAGVYSFCMCPGGIIAPAATAPGEVVVNGWSPSKRNNPYANSGLVMSVDESDFKPFSEFGPLRAMYFQSSVEQLAFTAAGSNLSGPAQRLMDFIDGKYSSVLPDCSYVPGITSVALDQVLPSKIASGLREGLKLFGKKMRGYLTNEAVLVATESRTSSPVRIPRDPDTLMHPEVKGLFPCGEGAGYAGGIMSAAIDGERCAEAAIAFYGKQ